MDDDAFKSLCSGIDIFAWLVITSRGSRFGAFVVPITLLKSSAVPGVLDVLEVPKEANAPDPSPNALDAPVVGDAREDVVVGRVL